MTNVSERLVDLIYHGHQLRLAMDASHRAEGRVTRLIDAERAFDAALELAVDDVIRSGAHDPRIRR